MFYSFARWLWPYLKLMSPIMAVGFVLFWGKTGDGKYAQMAAVQIVVSIVIVYVSPLFEEEE